MLHAQSNVLRGPSEMPPRVRDTYDLHTRQKHARAWLASRVPNVMPIPRPPDEYRFLHWKRDRDDALDRIPLGLSPFPRSLLVSVPPPPPSSVRVARAMMVDMERILKTHGRDVEIDVPSGSFVLEAAQLAMDVIGEAPAIWGYANMALPFMAILFPTLLPLAKLIETSTPFIVPIVMVLPRLKGIRTLREAAEALTKMPGDIVAQVILHDEEFTSTLGAFTAHLTSRFLPKSLARAGGKMVLRTGVKRIHRFWNGVLDWGLNRTLGPLQTANPAQLAESVQEQIARECAREYAIREAVLRNAPPEEIRRISMQHAEAPPVSSKTAITRHFVQFSAAYALAHIAEAFAGSTHYYEIPENTSVLHQAITQAKEWANMPLFAIGNMAQQMAEKWAANQLAEFTTSALLSLRRYLGIEEKVREKLRELFVELAPNGRVGDLTRGQSQFARLLERTVLTQKLRELTWKEVGSRLADVVPLGKPWKALQALLTSEELTQWLVRTRVSDWSRASRELSNAMYEAWASGDVSVLSIDSIFPRLATFKKWGGSIVLDENGRKLFRIMSLQDGEAVIRAFHDRPLTDEERKKYHILTRAEAVADPAAVKKWEQEDEALRARWEKRAVDDINVIAARTEWETHQESRPRFANTDTSPQMYYIDLHAHPDAMGHLRIGKKPIGSVAPADLASLLQGVSISLGKDDLLPNAGMEGSLFRVSTPDKAIPVYNAILTPTGDVTGVSRDGRPITVPRDSIQSVDVHISPVGGVEGVESAAVVRSILDRSPELRQALANIALRSQNLRERSELLAKYRAARESLLDTATDGWWNAVGSSQSLGEHAVMQDLRRSDISKDFYRNLVYLRRNDPRFRPHSQGAQRILQLSNNVLSPEQHRAIFDAEMEMWHRNVQTMDDNIRSAASLLQLGHEEWMEDAREVSEAFRDTVSNVAQMVRGHPSYALNDPVFAWIYSRLTDIQVDAPFWYRWATSTLSASRWAASFQQSLRYLLALAFKVGILHVPPIPVATVDVRGVSDEDRAQAEAARNMTDPLPPSDATRPQDPMRAQPILREVRRWNDVLSDQHLEQVTDVLLRLSAQGVGIGQLRKALSGMSGVIGYVGTLTDSVLGQVVASGREATRDFVQQYMRGAMQTYQQRSFLQYLSSFVQKRAKWDTPAQQDAAKRILHILGDAYMNPDDTVFSDDDLALLGGSPWVAMLGKGVAKGVGELGNLHGRRESEKWWDNLSGNADALFKASQEFMGSLTSGGDLGLVALIGSRAFSQLLPDMGTAGLQAGDLMKGVLAAAVATNSQAMGWYVDMSALLTRIPKGGAAAEAVSGVLNAVPLASRVGKWISDYVLDVDGFSAKVAAVAGTASMGIGGFMREVGAYWTVGDSELWNTVRLRLNDDMKTVVYDDARKPVDVAPKVQEPLTAGKPIQTRKGAQRSLSRLLSMPLKDAYAMGRPWFAQVAWAMFDWVVKQNPGARLTRYVFQRLADATEAMQKRMILAAPPPRVTHPPAFLKWKKAARDRYDSENRSASRRVTSKLGTDELVHLYVGDYERRMEQEIARRRSIPVVPPPRLTSQEAVDIYMGEQWQRGQDEEAEGTIDPAAFDETLDVVNSMHKHVENEAPLHIPYFRAAEHLNMSMANPFVRVTTQRPRGDWWRIWGAYILSLPNRILSAWEIPPMGRGDGANLPIVPSTSLPFPVFPSAFRLDPAAVARYADSPDILASILFSGDPRLLATVSRPDAPPGVLERFIDPWIPTMNDPFRWVVVHEESPGPRARQYRRRWKYVYEFNRLYWAPFLARYPDEELWAHLTPYEWCNFGLPAILSKLPMEPDDSSTFTFSIAAELSIPPPIPPEFSWLEEVAEDQWLGGSLALLQFLEP